RNNCKRKTGERGGTAGAGVRTQKQAKSSLASHANESEDNPIYSHRSSGFFRRGHGSHIAGRQEACPGTTAGGCLIAYGKLSSSSRSRCGCGGHAVGQYMGDKN